jgi:hypothetical protein
MGELIVSPIKNVGLVHGTLVGRSGCEGAYDTLRAGGVNAPMNPTISSLGDVAGTTQRIEDVDGPANLVGLRGGAPSVMLPLVPTSMPEGRCHTRCMDVEAISEQPERTVSL